MNLKALLIVSTAVLAANAFGQVPGTFTLDQSVLVGENVGNGFVGLSHDTFAPLLVKDGPAYSFMGFCTDLEIEAQWNTPYIPTIRVTTDSFYQQNQAPNVNSTLGSEISYIANTYGFTTDNDTAAGAQLAIWEIQGQSQSDIETFLNGTFNATVGADAAADVIAAEGDNDRGNHNISPWYESPFSTYPTQISQNFVQPVATPECPTTLVLGVGMIGLFLRRRARKA